MSADPPSSDTSTMAHSKSASVDSAPPKEATLERNSGLPATKEASESLTQPGEDLEKSSDDEKPPQPAPGGPGAGFPDGGLEANLVLLGGFCSLFCSFGWINAIGIFQVYYQQNSLSQYTPSTISWIPSMEVFLMFFGGPVVGKIFDNYGPRYLLLCGTFLHVFGLMMTSLSTKYYQIFLSQGVCSAFGASCICYGTMGSVATWFFKKRSTAFGIITAGSSLGGVIFPIMVQRLIPKIGFPWTMRVAAFTILGLLVIANLTVKSRLKPQPRPVNLMEFVRPLRDPAFSLVIAAGFVFFFAVFIPFNFVILQAERYNTSPYLASYLVPILNAASILGRILPGMAADKLGRFNTMIVTTGLSAVVVFALWLPSKGSALAITFSVVYGFTSGAFVALAPTLIAQISPIQQIGVRTGTCFFIFSFAGLVGNPIAGALIDAQHGDYIGLQVFSGACMFGGAGLYIVARWWQAGFKAKII